MSEFSHEEVKAATRQRHEWVMAEIRHRARVAMLAIGACGVLGVVLDLLTRSPWSLGAVLPGAVAIGWLGWGYPKRLEAQWDLDHAAIGQHLQREGLSR